MRIMTDLKDGNARIEFEKVGAITLASNELITIIHNGESIKTLSFNELVNAIR